MSFDKLLKKLLHFRKERDWEQFHNPKNLAISLSIEANELLEHFQWLNLDESQEYSQKHKDEIAEEMADVLNYLLLMADNLNINLINSAIKKIEKSKKKYPVEKSKGSSKKYNKL